MGMTEGQEVVMRIRLCVCPGSAENGSLVSPLRGWGQITLFSVSTLGHPNSSTLTFLCTY